MKDEHLQEARGISDAAMPRGKIQMDRVSGKRRFSDPVATSMLQAVI
jgi:hypothetical protein